MDVDMLMLVVMVSVMSVVMSLVMWMWMPDVLVMPRHVDVVDVRAVCVHVCVLHRVHASRVPYRFLTHTCTCTRIHVTVYAHGTSFQHDVTCIYMCREHERVAV